MAGGKIRSAMTGDYGIEIRWSSVADVATNSSEITVKVYVLYPSINISKRSGCYTTIDGSKAEFSTSAIQDEYAGEALLKTRKKTIEHETDGTKRISLKAYFPIYLKSESLGWIYEKTASGTAVLDDIPRASQVSSQTQSVTVNGANRWDLAVNRASDAFYHKATLSIGAYSHVTEAFATTTGYAIPAEWLNAIPNAMRGTVSVSIQTYSDSTCETALGDPVETSFEIVAPDTAGPVISDGWASVSPYNEGTAASAFDLYVQGYSRAEVTFDESMIRAQYGASIASVQILMDGATVSASPYRTKVLTAAGSHTITCTATDSRGLKAVKVLGIDVQSYANPTLRGISLYRCNASGVADEAGAYIYFKATAVIASLAGQNTITLTAAYRAKGSDTWTQAQLSSGAASVLGGALSATISYEARITATDAPGNSATYTALIGTADVAFNIRPGGKGAAFGKYAETDGVLDVSDWDIVTGGDMEAANLNLTGRISARNIWPVGSVYMTYSSVSPGNILDGNWIEVSGTGLPFNVWRRTS